MGRKALKPKDRAARRRASKQRYEIKYAEERRVAARLRMQRHRLAVQADSAKLKSYNLRVQQTTESHRRRHGHPPSDTTSKKPYRQRAAAQSVDRASSSPGSRHTPTAEPGLNTPQSSSIHNPVVLVPESPRITHVSGTTLLRRLDTHRRVATRVAPRSRRYVPPMNLSVAAARKAAPRGADEDSTESDESCDESGMDGETTDDDWVDEHADLHAIRWNFKDHPPVGRCGHTFGQRERPSQDIKVAPCDGTQFPHLFASDHPDIMPKAINLRMWAEGARESVLAPHIPYYAAAMDRGLDEENAALNEICFEFNARIPWWTSDFEEPVLRPYVPGSVFVETENLTDEQKAWKEERLRILRGRIRRWYRYRIQRAHNLRRSYGCDPRKDPFAVFILRYIGWRIPKKRRQGYQQYMREHWAELLPQIDEAWDAYIEQNPELEGTTHMMGFRSDFVRPIFRDLQPEVQAEYVARAQAQTDAENAEYDAAMKRGPVLTPEGIHRALIHTTDFAGQVIKELHNHTQNNFLLVYGGPDPEQGGKIVVRYLTIGRDLTQKASHIDQARPQAFDAFLKQYAGYLQKCYTLEQCQKTALPGTYKDPPSSGSSSLPPAFIEPRRQHVAYANVDSDDEDYSDEDDIQFPDEEEATMDDEDDDGFFDSPPTVRPAVAGPETRPERTPTKLLFRMVLRYTDAHPLLPEVTKLALSLRRCPIPSRLLLRLTLFRRRCAPTKLITIGNNILLLHRPNTTSLLLQNASNIPRRRHIPSNNLPILGTNLHRRRVITSLLLLQNASNIPRRRHIPSNNLPILGTNLHRRRVITSLLLLQNASNIPPAAPHPIQQPPHSRHQPPPPPRHNQPPPPPERVEYPAAAPHPIQQPPHPRHQPPPPPRHNQPPPPPERVEYPAAAPHPIQQPPHPRQQPPPTTAGPS
ncbi:hypothetical protein MKEN_00439300 [Mycena kentingensis (nom. inval.)]|nr:hypothetical protein MKEN_00439300 [Mycena kentingensis (nom. inval.)]